MTCLNLGETDELKVQRMTGESFLGNEGEQDSVLTDSSNLRPREEPHKRLHLKGRNLRGQKPPPPTSPATSSFRLLRDYMVTLRFTDPLLTVENEHSRTPT